MAGLPWNPNPSPLDVILNKKNNELLKKTTTKKTTTKPSSTSTKKSSTTKTSSKNSSTTSSTKSSTNTATPNINLFDSQAAADQLYKRYGVTPDTPQYQNDTSTLPPPPTATDNSTNTASTQQLYQQTIQNQTVQQNPGGGAIVTQIQNRPDQSGIISTQQDVQRRRNQEMREQKQYLAGYNPETGEPIIVNEATTQSRFGYNPQDPDYIRERGIINDSITELTNAQTVVNTAMQDMPGLIRQSNEISNMPEGSSLFIDNNQNNVFDEGIDTKLTREQALQNINEIIANRQQIISQGPQIVNDLEELENSRSIIDTMQRLGYEVQKDPDGSLTFTEPDSKTVYDANYGSNPFEYAKLSMLASPLGIQTAGAILQSTITGDKSSLDSEMQRLAKYGLDFRHNMEIDGAKAAALQGLVSPAAIQGVYMPLATAGIGQGINMLAQGASKLLPTGTKILSKFGDDGANILKGLYDTGKTLTAPLRYTATKLGTTRLGNLALASGIYGAMEGPRMLEIMKDRPQDIGGELASSLFTYGLSTAAVMSGRPKLSSQEKQLQKQMIDDSYRSLFKTNPFKRYDFTLNTMTNKVTGQKYADLFGKKLVYNTKEHTIMTSFNELNKNPRWTGLWNTNLGTSVPDTEFIPAVAQNQNSLMRPLNMQQLYGKGWSLARTNTLGLPFRPDSIYNIRNTGIYTQPLKPEKTGMKPLNMDEIYGKGWSLEKTNKTLPPIDKDSIYKITKIGPIRYPTDDFSMKLYDRQSDKDTWMRSLYKNTDYGKGYKLEVGKTKTPPIDKDSIYKITDKGVFREPSESYMKKLRERGLKTDGLMQPLYKEKIYGRGYRLATEKDKPMIPPLDKEATYKITEKGVIKYTDKPFKTRLTQVKTLKQMKNEPGLPDYRSYGKDLQTIMKPPKEKTSSLTKQLQKQMQYQKQTQKMMDYQNMKMDSYTKSDSVLMKSLQQSVYKGKKRGFLPFIETINYEKLMTPSQGEKQLNLNNSSFKLAADLKKMLDFDNLKALKIGTGLMSGSVYKQLSLSGVKEMQIQKTGMDTDTVSLSDMLQSSMMQPINYQALVYKAKTVPPYKFSFRLPSIEGEGDEFKKLNKPMKFSITDFMKGEWNLQKIESGFSTENINQEIQKMMKGMKL